MAIYRRKNDSEISIGNLEIEANQFVPPLRIPEGVFNVYGAPNGEVYTGQIWTISGERANLKSGDFVIKFPNSDRHYSVSESYIQKNYDLISE